MKNKKVFNGNCVGDWIRTVKSESRSQQKPCTGGRDRRGLPSGVMTSKLELTDRIARSAEHPAKEFYGGKTVFIIWKHGPEIGLEGPWQ